jgi:nicotinamidase/pyrazinamidase
MRIDPRRDALVVVDLQRDFLPGGPLGVAGGDAIVEPIARLARRFPLVVATQDWHPPGHVSFASSHAGAAPFTVTQLQQGEQELWPDHCVRGSPGAALHPALPDEAVTLLLRKGTRRELDSYSAFRENLDATGARPPTGLAGWLRDRGVTRVFLCGLARDFCVRASAVDAAGEGFDAIVLDDLTRAVFPDRSGATDALLARAGVRLSQSGELEG